jgi:hypothetical protein
MYLLLRLREFQGSILDLLMKFLSKSPAICRGMMDILMEAAKFPSSVSFVGPPNTNTTSHFQVGHHTCINTWKAFSTLSSFKQNEQ